MHVDIRGRSHVRVPQLNLGQFHTPGFLVNDAPYRMPEDVKAMRPLCSAKNAFSSFLDKPMPIIMELLHFAEAPDLIHILLTPWERWAAIEPVSNSPYTPSATFS